MTDIYDTIASKIVQEQVGLIGPIALDVAKKVPSIKVSDGDIHIVDADKSEAINALIAGFETLFGAVSVHVSKDAVKDELHELGEDAIPSRLK